MEVIPDKYATLDGVTGPFDIFQEYKQNSATMTTIGLQSSQKYSGATEGDPDVYHLDFSGYSSVDDLDGVGIIVDGERYVLTKTPSQDYTGVYNKIDISGCGTVGDVITKLATSFSGFTGARNGSTLDLTTTEESSAANNYSMGGFSAAKKTTPSTTTTTPKRDPSPSTGAFTPAKKLSGGTNQIGYQSPDPDVKYVPGTKASLTASLSGASAGSGITVSDPNAEYIQFQAGSAGFQYDSKLGIYTVGIDANASTTLNGVSVSYNGRTITFTARSTGTSANSYTISDGIPGRAGSTTTTPETTTEAVKAYTGNIQNDNTGTDGSPATYTIDLSSVPDTTSESDLETIIADLRGKNINYDGYSYSYTFIDSDDKTSLASQAVGSGSTIDLASLRTTVGQTVTTTTTDASGATVTTTATATVRSALSQLLLSRLGRSSAASDGSGNVVLTSRSKGTSANDTTLNVSQDTYRHYDIDYGAWFQNNAGAVIPNDLYDKGFHFYCATDAKQWFNVVFTSGENYEKDRPASGTDTEDIKTMPVDVSNVKNASDLVTAIYEQTLPYLTGPDPNYNHHYRIAAEPSTGVLTIYDQRRYDVNTSYYDYQEKGAKIADGIMDNVIKSTKEMMVDRVIIQHTDHADQNIRLNLPRTTLDQVFQFIVGKQSVSDYNVMTKKMREKLLGNPPVTKGILDKGIEYLTDANTIIGAQTNHLGFAHANIKAQQESTQSSESTIRDADMAKEMVHYTKSNILAQTAQSMLAQANQSAGSVLNLLR
ncbi:flagellin [uncultured Selenomonas sp.]|uniref:flagellin n=1 Tax=uncultured Selenomonas sp. TaxID=159275 RepID=UPI00344E17CE